jgi:hypothetical protein
VRLALNAVVFLALTLLTQLGGVAWLIAIQFRHFWIVFAFVYAAFWGAAYNLAPALGRTSIACFGTELRMQSPLYCLLMRNYVAPELLDVAQAAASTVAQNYPGTITLALDGSFPFFDGMPLMPHLSHDDGEKLDFAFYYQANSQYLPATTRSPIGYWAFELDDETTCPPAWLTGRWNMRALQSLWPNRPLEAARTTLLVKTILANPRVTKAFLEPPLAAQLGLSDPKLRFQGCRAARHDDHLHIQL